MDIFYFLECKEGKTEGYSRETAFLKTLFICFYVHVCGRQWAYNACLKPEKGIRFAGDGVTGDYYLPRVNDRS